MRFGASLLVAIAAGCSVSFSSAATVYDWETAVSGDWNDSGLWSPDGVPGAGAGDTVTIDASGLAYTVTLNVNPAGALAGFTLDNSDAVFSAVSRTLRVDGPSMLSDGSVIWRDSTWTGSGTLTNSAAMTVLGYSSTISTAGFDQNGTLLIQGNLSGGTAKLTSAGGFSNAGTITLDSSGGGYSCYLDVTDGALTNTSTGIINVDRGAGGSRYFRGSLTNDGTVNINTNTAFTKTVGIYTNNGQFNIAAGTMLSISASSQLFNQSGGALDIDGTFYLSSMGFNYLGGTILGTPLLRGCTLNIGPGATNPASFLLVDFNNTLTGNIHAGQLLTLQGSATHGGTAKLTSTGGFSNAGTVTIDSSGGGYTCYLDVTDGTLTNTATGTINVDYGAGGSRFFMANLTNDGTVNISTNTTFTKSGGVYTNNGQFNIATDKTLYAGALGQTFNQSGGTLDIDGTLKLENMAFNYLGGTILGTPALRDIALNIDPAATNPASFLLIDHENELTGDIHAGQLLTVQGGFPGGTAKLTSATGFRNAGTIAMDTSGGGQWCYLDVTDGTLTNTATGTINLDYGVGGPRCIRASLTNDGTINVNAIATFVKTSGVYTNNGRFNIATGKTLTISGSNQTFSQSGGTLDIDGTFNLTGMTFNYLGGTILGTPLLRDVTLNIGPGATNPASFLLIDSDNGLTGDIHAGQLLTVQGNLTGGTVKLTSASGFRNAGTITMDSSGGGYSCYLDVADGTLTNTATGTINVNPGAGGSRYVRAELANEGTVNWNTSGSLAKSGAAHVNRGDFNIADGKTVTLGGTSFTNAANGTIAGCGKLVVDKLAFASDGSVSPGFSTGMLTIEGTYNQSAGGSLDIEIGGTIAGDDYDRLLVDGAANLDGSLIVSLLEGFVPEPDDTFTILTADEISGFFANAETTVYFSGGWFDVDYSDTTVVLSNYQVPEPGVVAMVLGVLAVLWVVPRRR